MIHLNLRSFFFYIISERKSGSHRKMCILHSSARLWLVLQAFYFSVIIRRLYMSPCVSFLKECSEWSLVFDQM